MLTSMCVRPTGGSQGRITGGPAQSPGGKGYVKALLRHAMGGRIIPDGISIPSSASVAYQGGAMQALTLA